MSDSTPAIVLSKADLQTAELRIDDRGRLMLKRPDASEVHIIARRAFPWSRPDQYISLRTKEGNEIILIESFQDLPTQIRGVLTQFLRESTFIPKIKSIQKISMEHGHQEWSITTESGPLTIRVQEREDIRFISDVRFSVKDVHGSLFEIVDASSLDPLSRVELGKVV